jgi:hypothetical protein
MASLDGAQEGARKGNEMSEWQPISTAPENTDILTYAEWDESPIGVSRFEAIEVRREEVESETHNSKGRRRIIRERTETAREWTGAHWEPTHWMPLPEPPKER